MRGFPTWRAATAQKKRHVMLISGLVGAVLVLATLLFWRNNATARMHFSAGTPQPAVPAVLKLFERYPVVALAETHWSRPQGDFYVALIRAPGFAAGVNDIVLECANQLYQPVLDRYVNGEDVSFDQISQVWRNTIKVMGWESPIYAHLLETVREVNRGLPTARRLRVLAGDSAVEWGRIQTHADWLDAYQENDPFVAVIEEQVLAKHRKALVIMGVNHLTRGGTRDGGTNVTTRVEKRFPHSMYVVLQGQVPLRADPQVTSLQPPVLYPLKGTRLGDAMFLPHRKVEDEGDAFLYAGKEEMAWPDWERLQGDTVYFRELQRRHLIEFGCPLDLNRWKRFERACP